MTELFDGDGSVRSPGPWLLGGSLAAILSLDLLAPAIAAPALRLLLALASGLTLLAAVVLGVIDSPAYAVGSLLAAPVVALYAVSGLLLPWDQLAFTVGQFSLEALLAVPVVGTDLASALFGGVTLSAESLRLTFRYHYAIVAAGVVGLGIAAVRVRGELTRNADGN